MDFLVVDILKQGWLHKRGKYQYIYEINYIIFIFKK
jgi:hypothetical protein